MPAVQRQEHKPRGDAAHEAQQAVGASNRPTRPAASSPRRVRPPFEPDARQAPSHGHVDEDQVQAE